VTFRSSIVLDLHFAIRFCDDYTRGSCTRQLDERIGDTLVLTGDFMIPASRRNRVLFALTIVAMVHSARAEVHVREEILERPAPLRSGIGKAHEDVTTRFKAAQAYYDQGLAYLHSYVWIEAARSFHQALRLDAKLAMAQLGLSYALAELGDSAGAKQASQQASALAAPVSDREKARIRLRALQLGDGSEPAKHRSNYLKEFDLVLTKYPHDAELLMLRGQAAQQVSDAMGMPGMGAGEGSLAFYERALAEQPHYFAAHHYLTHAYENVGRVDLALKHAEEYVSLAPAVPHAHHMRGHILRRANRTQEAIAEFRKADELALVYFRTEKIPAEYDWQYHHNLDLLGVSCQYAGQMQLADSVLRRSFELTSIEFSQELNEGAWPMLLLSEGRTGQAQSAAKALMDRADPVVQALGRLVASRIAMRLGHADEAVEEGDRALHLLREAPHGGVLLPELELVQGELLLRRRQFQKGGAMLRDAVFKLRKDPASDRWAQNLLRIEAVETLARDQGDWTLAGDIATQMRQYAPDYAGTHYALAKEAQHGGNVAAARQEYQAAIRGWSAADTDLAVLTDARRQLAALANPR
jgi:tetratricopeptide (TPR) repeat protein